MLLVARSFKRQVFVKQAFSQRCYTMSERSAARPSRSLRISAAGGGALTATLMLGLGYSLYADAPLPSKESVPIIPLSKSLTSYVVYSLCSVPGLVDASPALLSFCTSIPGLRQLTEALVRVTFFEQVLAFLTWVIEMLTRNVVHSLSAVTPPTNAYHLYVGFVRRTKARCLRIAWKPMLRRELALRVSGMEPCIGVS
jgi:hypothetical protein